MALDTLKIANDLKAAGFTQEQAEVTARVFQDFAATELDISTLQSALRELELRLEAKIDKAQAEMKLWFIGTALALAGFILAALRFFAH